MSLRLSVLALLCVSGCGVSQSEYNARLTDFEKCQAELGHNQVELGAAQARLEDKRHDLEQRDEQITKLESDARSLARNLTATQREMDALRRAHAMSEQRNEVYRTLVARLRDAIGAGTLAVEVRKGKMIVKLGDAILFDAGQATLKSAGMVALRQVAQALKEIPDRDFLVAGHTDNRPIKNSPYASNWELSTARAVTVVRYLQAEGLDPRHLAAAGYSEFDTVADNDSPETRAQNRRIEVVVMPRIDELPGIDVSEPASSPQAAEPAPPATGSPTPPATPIP
ncbi:MAG: hypothetical protein JWN44_3981 [Myxococcales bacterium]|nr:hypothetical protein [Myxococcales bacterium]